MSKSPAILVVELPVHELGQWLEPVHPRIDGGDYQLIEGLAPLGRLLRTYYPANDWIDLAQTTCRTPPDWFKRVQEPAVSLHPLQSDFLQELTRP
jgi:hypothetical protein